MKSYRSRYGWLHSMTTTRNFWKSLVILAIGILLTMVVTFHTKNVESIKSDRDFKLICDEIKTKIDLRLHNNAQLLRSGAALFMASDAVTRLEWREFCERSKIEKNLPGIQGVGFSILVPKDQVQLHIQNVIKQGFKQYSIRPAGDRNMYTSIIYLEPFTGRNLRAFGYDMMTEPIRKRAMEISRDSDIAMLSGKVNLVQETDQDIQAGALMYVPVYTYGMPINTLEQRRSAIKGWVYSPYRMDDLMQGIVGRWDENREERIQLRVYDEYQSANSLLFDSQKNDTVLNNNSASRAVAFPIKFNGKRWILCFTQTREPHPFFEGKVFIVFLAGYIMSILLFFLSLSYFNTLYRGAKIADKLLAELRESESRFKNLFTRHGSIMLLIEPETGKIIDANNAAAGFYGYSVETLNAMSIYDLNTMTREQIAEERRRASNNDQNYFIFRHKLAHGEERTVEVHSSPIGYLGKTFLFSIVHDITERKQAEAELHDAHVLLNSIIENSPNALWISDEHGTMLRMNQACRDNLFLRDEEVVGRYNIFHDNIIESQGFMPLVNDVFKKGITARFTTSYDTASAKGLNLANTTKVALDISISPIVNQYGKVTNAVIQHTDVTLRWASEDNLMKQAETLEVLVQERTMLLENANTELVFQNEEKRKRADELVIANEELAFQNEEKGKRADELVIANAELAFQNEEKGKRADELVHANHELSFSLSELNQFAYISNHDLQEPLRTLTTFSKLLQDDYQDKLDEDGNRYLDFIHNSALRMSKMVRDLFDYSLLGKESTRTLLDCNTIVDAVLNDLEDSMKQNNVKITVQELPVLSGYETEMRLLFQNLIINAIKFHKKDRQPVINITAKRVEKFWQFSIQDNGIGIDEKNQEKIFIIFQRLHKRNEYGGTGIGLAHCKKVSEMHGGRIWVESTPEIGSTFLFTIPEINCHEEKA